MNVHERLYALAAFSDPDPAEELTQCADAARDMLAAGSLRKRKEKRNV